jgi:ribokinase
LSRVVVVGSINMDLVVRAPRFALAGETILGNSFHTIPGGKGSNQAVAARRMGADVAVIGRVGSDSFGEAMRRSLAGEGIDVGHVETTEAESTGVALITVEDSGENTIIVVPGANSRLSTGDVEAARRLIGEADILLMQLEIPLPVVEFAARIAKEGRAAVVLNAAPARTLPTALLSLVDYLVVNESEANLMAGRDSASPEAASGQAAARSLQAMDARSVVVTLGPEGSILVEPNSPVAAARSFAVRAVDTTAAGDAFVGAFAVALAEGRTPEEALTWGNAAGALAVTREGAQPSLPRRTEVEAFLREKSRRGAMKL